MLTHRKVADVLVNGQPGQTVEIKGWVRTRRDKPTFSFVEINDGSCLANLQAIVESTTNGYEHVKDVSTGSSVAIFGTLKESEGKGQRIEVLATSLRILGTADPHTFPLQKKGHSMEFLRTIGHLRPRTNTFGCMARVRNAICRSIHDFFQTRGFVYVHSPIITTSDCEGAGEMFQVTTLPLEGRGTRVEGRGTDRTEGQRNRSERDEPASGTSSVTRPSPLDPPAPSVPRPSSLDPRPSIDYSADFFGRKASLTVSGQLEAEIFATSVGDCYTFGPTFRAENSNTTRHLAEFWMVEPEMPFYELEDDMKLAEEFIKAVIRDVLKSCPDDMQFFNDRIEKTVLSTCENIVGHDFIRLPYTEAVDILLKSGRKFDYPIEWGKDLQSEHERFLTEEHFRQPVILFDYPRAIKSFYMRCNDDGKTVRAMDVLVPRVGEIIGGSQREERYDVLVERMKECGLNPDDYWWYLDLRKYGTVPHSGFGLGLERTVQLITGMANIRDCIPFPRTPGSAEF